jgi:hypothetical protein
MQAETPLLFLRSYQLLNYHFSIVICIFNLSNPSGCCPGVYSAPNTNEYQKQKNNVSGEQSAVSAEAAAICEPIV